MSEQLVLDRAVQSPELSPLTPAVELAPSSAEVEASMLATISSIEAAFAEGRLQVPEALTNPQRDVKGGSGPDASNKLYS